MKAEATLEWLRPTLPVAFIALFAELGYAVLNNSTLPVYFKEGLGIDTALIGPIMTPFFMSELLKGPLGILADKIGRKPLMVFGPAVTIVTALAYTFVHTTNRGSVMASTIVCFALLRLLDGLGASSLWPAMFAYLGDVVKPERRASAMSLLNVVYMAALAFGFLAGGFADDTFGRGVAGGQGLHNAARYFPSFYLTSALFGLATLCAIFGIRPTRNSAPRDSWPPLEGTDSSGQEQVTLKSVKAALAGVPGILLLAFVTFFGIGCIALQVKIFALDQFGITETNFGLLCLWPALLIGALAVPLGHLADKWGQIRSIRLGFSVSAFSLWAMIVLFRTPHVGELSVVVGGFFLGIGFVIAFPAWLAYLTTLSGDSHRGTVIGAASTSQGLGVLLGILLGGWLYKHAAPAPSTSHVVPFVASALFLTAGAVLTFLVLKPGQSKKLVQS